jgi:3-dehydroquinate synthase
MSIKQEKNTALVLKELQAFLVKRKYSRLFVLTDENTQKYCYPIISEVFGKHEVITILSGEEHKTIETCSYLWSKLSGSGADRNSLLINLGGGVICDMGGFAASVYKRGIDFIHIPTTLLAMCDSCIGGKTAVDMDNMKNVIGTFTDAEAVFVYPYFLATLPERHILSGFAEMLKHGVIADKAMFAEFEAIRALPEKFDEFIFRSLKIKQDIVSKDPFEYNIRKSLNFGHTVGHALESYFLEFSPDNYLLHGEAVAVGMIAETYIAYSLKILQKSEMQRIVDCVLTYFRLPEIPENKIEAIALLCLNDKKNDKGKILLSLPEAIGNVKVNIPVPISQIKKSLIFCNSIR